MGSKVSWAALALSVLGYGCSLVVAVDRSLIGGGAGGEGGGGTGGCSIAADCPAPANPCLAATCSGGVCGTEPAAAGPVGTQVPGDCMEHACDGSGNETDAPLDGDVPVDGLECTADVCTAGVPSNPPVLEGTPCGMNGMLACDDTGQCVGCGVASDCGPDTECQHPTCTAGVCGVQNEPGGTPLAAQTDGDCSQEVCDGIGGTQTIADGMDLPDDAETCTDDVCTGTTPSNPPLPAATSCSEGQGKLCDGSGACVQCLVPGDCAGVDDECQTRTCNAGACGVSFAMAGAAVASQTAGDCSKSVCDGAGNVVPANDDLDLPNDNNPCTIDGCSSGMTDFQPAMSGTSCGMSLVCNATGQCVGCNVPGDCPGADDECKTRTCTAGTCGLNLTAAGFAVASQTSGDCKENVCDGNGNVVSQNDDGDVADDGNACTSDSCSAGSPVHAGLPINTVCPTGFCSAASTCVPCNAPSQCPGMDDDCKTRTCNANVCGESFTPSGIATPSQTPGDCKENQCDGNGTPVVVTDGADVPFDDGSQCTNESCSGQMPVHPPKPIDTICNQGGSYCDGAGSCVQCNSDPQCASLVCDEPTHTCSAPTCSDLVENGTETDVDCGGTCPSKCDAGEGCLVHSDCSGGACNSATMTCQITCADPPAVGATCASYCACMTSTCAGKFVDSAACLNACAAFSSAQLCCRAYHCSAAMADAATHCPHAAGEAVCP